jgi:uncharacterized membrane protein (UPF0127 family)
MVNNRMNIVIKDNSRKIKVKNVKKVSKLEEGIGLMFHRREKCPAMLFEFSHPNKMLIHSLFVFFKFGAVWLDDKNKIVDKKIVKPFKLSISSGKPFYKLLEIPLNKYYKKEIKLLFKNL